MTKQAQYSRLLEADFATQRAAILRALGNPTRLRIVAHLAGAGETTVGALADALGLPQPSISRALAWLRMSGLVGVRRAGSFGHYHIAMPRLSTLLGCLERCGTEDGDDESTDTGVTR